MSPYIIPGIKRNDENSMERIIKSVCDYFKVSREMINQRTRRREFVLARQYSMYFIKQKTGHTLKTIGEQFGEQRYDHTSVIHAVNTIQNFLSIKDEMTVRNIEAIKRILNEPY